MKSIVHAWIFDFSLILLCWHRFWWAVLSIRELLALSGSRSAGAKIFLLLMGRRMVWWKWIGGLLSSYLNPIEGVSFTGVNSTALIWLMKEKAWCCIIGGLNGFMVGKGRLHLMAGWLFGLYSCYTVRRKGRRYRV